MSLLSEDLTMAQASEFKEMFEQVDKNKDGKITQKELRAILRSLNSPRNEDEIRFLMEREKIEGEEIDLEDFLSMMEKELNFIDDETAIKNAFKVFDKNGNGFITDQALRTIMTTLGDKLSAEEANRMCMECDTDRNGEIHMDEFVRCMLKN
eukprot:UN07331